MKRMKILIALALLMCGLSALIQLLWNTRLAGLIDALTANGPLSAATVTGLLPIVAAMSLTAFAGRYIGGHACESASHGLRMAYARYLASLSVAEAEKLNVGEQSSAAQNEIGAVSGYINNNLLQLISDGVNFVFTFVFLLTVNPALTLSANLPAMLLVAYVFWSGGVIRKATERSQAARADMNRHADTLISAFPVIKLYNAVRMAADNYRAAVDGWRLETARLERAKAQLMSLSGVLSNAPLLLLLLIGGRMALGGVITVGTLYIFINLSGNVSGVLMNMPGHIAAFKQFAGNMARIRLKLLWV
jgi:ABC-type multidrug transport system fused ATPase/permease subunit